MRQRRARVAAKKSWRWRRPRCAPPRRVMHMPSRLPRLPCINRDPSVTFLPPVENIMRLNPIHAGGFLRSLANPVAP